MSCGIRILTFLSEKLQCTLLMWYFVFLQQFPVILSKVRVVSCRRPWLPTPKCHMLFLVSKRKTCLLYNTQSSYQSWTPTVISSTKLTIWQYIIQHYKHLLLGEKLHRLPKMLMEFKMFKGWRNPVRYGEWRFAAGAGLPPSLR